MHFEPRVSFPASAWRGLSLVVAFVAFDLFLVFCAGYIAGRLSSGATPFPF